MMFKNKKIKTDREETGFKNLMSLIEKKAVPDKKFKEKLFLNLMENYCFDMQNSLNYSFLEKFIFEKPWRLAVPLSLAISIIFRICTGSMFDKFIFSMLAGI